MRPILAIPLLVACKGSIDLDNATVEEIQDLCRESTPEVHIANVLFPADPPGCAWGEDGNLDMAQGQVTARAEQRVVIELPEDVVVCDLVFDFAVDGDLEQTLYYDDNMFILYNDVVLAASYGGMVEQFPVSRRASHLRLGLAGGLRLRVRQQHPDVLPG